MAAKGHAASDCTLESNSVISNKRIALVEIIARLKRNTALTWTYCTVRRLKEYWDCVLHCPPDYQARHYSASEYESANAKEMFAFVCGEVEFLRKCGGILHQDSTLCAEEYIDDIGLIFAVMLLSSKSEDCFCSLLRVILSSPIADQYVMRIAQVSPLLVSCVTERILDMLERRSSQEGAVLDHSGRYRYPVILTKAAVLGGRNTCSVIRGILTARCRLSGVCLDLTRYHLRDAASYLNGLLPRHDKANVPAVTVKLENHWLFSNLEASIASNFICELLKEATDYVPAIFREEEGYSSLFQRIRVCCALLSAPGFVEICMDPSAHGIPVYIQEVANLLHKFLDAVIDSFPNHRTDMTNHSAFPALCRSAIALVISYISSTRRFAALSSSSERGIDYLHTYTLLCHIVTPLPFESLLVYQHNCFCYFIRCCTSLNRIAALREICAKHLGIASLLEYVPHSSYLFLSQVLTSSVIDSDASDSSPGSLIEKDHEVLLRHLPIPKEISSLCEFPGDWISSLLLLMRCRMLTPDHIKGCGVDTSLREIMMTALRRVKSPPHGWLQEVLDTWIDQAVNGTRDNTVMRPLVDKNADGGTLTTQKSTLSKAAVPIFPIDVLEFTKNLLYDQNPSNQKRVPTEVCELLDKEYGVFAELDFSDTDSEVATLVSMAKLKEMFKSGAPYSCGVVHTDAEYLAAITCYISLKYQSLSSMSCRTNYNCILTCDPRELPLEDALCIHLSVASSCEASKCDANGALCYSDCASNLLSSFLQLLRQICPEVLLKERRYRLWARFCRRYVLSSSNVVATEASSCEVADLTINDAVSLLAPPIRAIHIMLRLQQLSEAELSSVLVGILQNYTVTSTSQCSLSKSHSRDSTQSTTGHSGKVSWDGLWRLWRLTHAIHPRPQRFELDMANLLFEIGEVQRPRVIVSYGVLVREPLLLLRLPMSMLQDPLFLRIVLFIHRSVTVASRTSAHEALRVVRSRYKSTKDAAIPSGRSYLELCTQVDDTEYIVLQELISIRALLELWSETYRNSASSNVCGTVQHTTTVQNLLSALSSSIATMFFENDLLLDAVLYYGILYWPSFYLVSYNERIFSRIVTKVLDSVSGSQIEPLYSTTKAMEVLLQHICFIFRVKSMRGCSASVSEILSSLAYTFENFVQKSLSSPLWKQVPSSTSVGTKCVDAIASIADHYPKAALRIVTVLTVLHTRPKYSVVTVLTNIQNDLIKLRNHICATAIPLAIQKRMRSNSEANECNFTEMKLQSSFRDSSKRSVSPSLGDTISSNKKLKA